MSGWAWEMALTMAGFLAWGFRGTLRKRARKDAMFVNSGGDMHTTLLSAEGTLGT